MGRYKLHYTGQWLSVVSSLHCVYFSTRPSVVLTINNSLSPWCAVVRCTVVSERPAQSYCMPYRGRKVGAVAPSTLQAHILFCYIIGPQSCEQGKRFVRCLRRLVLCVRGLRNWEYSYCNFISYVTECFDFWRVRIVAESAHWFRYDRLSACYQRRSRWTDFLEIRC